VTPQKRFGCIDRRGSYLTREKVQLMLPPQRWFSSGGREKRSRSFNCKGKMVGTEEAEGQVLVYPVVGERGGGVLERRFSKEVVGSTGGKSKGCVILRVGIFPKTWGPAAGGGGGIQDGMKKRENLPTMKSDIGRPEDRDTRTTQAEEMKKCRGKWNIRGI